MGWGNRESIPTKRPRNRKKVCGIRDPKERWDTGSGESTKERTAEGLRRGHMSIFCLCARNNRQLEVHSRRVPGSKCICYIVPVLPYVARLVVSHLVASVSLLLTKLRAFETA